MCVPLHSWSAPTSEEHSVVSYEHSVCCNNGQLHVPECRQGSRVLTEHENCAYLMPSPQTSFVHSSAALTAVSPPCTAYMYARYLLRRCGSVSECIQGADMRGSAGCVKQRACYSPKAACIAPVWPHTSRNQHPILHYAASAQRAYSCA